MALPAGSTSSQTFGVDLLWHPSRQRGDRRGSRCDILARVESGANTPRPSLRRRLDPARAQRHRQVSIAWPARTRRCSTGRRALAPRADYCVAVGTCAAFGGVPAGDPDPTDACGLQYDGAEAGGALGRDYRSRKGLPVINVAGCAPHPGWIMETFAALALGDLCGRRSRRARAAEILRQDARPSRLRAQRISTSSRPAPAPVRSRLPDGASRLQGDAGGRRLQPARLERRRNPAPTAAFACIACTSPGFEGRALPHVTPKIAGIPVGLPLDMPKAWFMTLAALSKSATPERVRKNAEADRIVAESQEEQMTRRK